MSATDFLSSNPYGAIANAGVGLADTVVGLINNAKLKKEANALNKTRPIRTTSPESEQDLSLNESELGSGGLSQKSQYAYDTQQNKQEAASLNAILRGGGSVNNVSDIYNGSQEGRLKIAQLSDQLRLQKIANLMKSRETMTNEEDKNFLFNQWMPYADKAQAIGQQRQNAQAEIFSGLQTMAGGVSALGGSKGSGKDYSYLNNGI